MYGCGYTNPEHDFKFTNSGIRYQGWNNTMKIVRKSKNCLTITLINCSTSLQTWNVKKHLPPHHHNHHLSHVMVEETKLIEANSLAQITQKSHSDNVHLNFLTLNLVLFSLYHVYFYHIPCKTKPRTYVTLQTCCYEKYWQWNKEFQRW